MHKSFFSGLLTVGLLLPAMVHAEPVQSSLPIPDLKTEQVFVIRPAQILAVGVGVISGAVIVEALISSDVGYLVGGVVGGYLANIWYGGRQLEIHMGTPPKI